MTIKMGRSEWLDLVCSAIASGTTPDAAMIEADTVLKEADNRFGTLEELAKADDDEEDASLDRKLAKMLAGFTNGLDAYVSAFNLNQTPSGEALQKAFDAGYEAAKAGVVQKEDRVVGRVPTCPEGVNYRAWLKTLSEDELKLVEMSTSAA